jgi:hypothetical protein
MIKLITDLPERVLGLKASGEVTSEDHQNVLVYPPRSPHVDTTSAEASAGVLSVVGDLLAHARQSSYRSSQGSSCITWLSMRPSARSWIRR